jgi:hypothetical protein
VCWPRLITGYPEGRGPSYERLQLARASDGSLLEVVCVHDRDMSGRGIGRYYALAAQAAALLPTDFLSHPDLITQPDPPCTGRTPFREADRWTWCVFRCLRLANLLRSQQIPEARAEAFWFAGDAFAASAAAIRLGLLSPQTSLSGTPCAPTEGSKGKTGRPPDSRKQEVVKCVRELKANRTPWKNISDAVFEKFKVRYTAETLRGYLKSG